MHVSKHLSVFVTFTTLGLFFGSGLLYAEDKKSAGSGDKAAKAEEKPASKPAAPDSAKAKSKVAFHAAQTDQDSIAVPSPPFSEGIFPCSECHEADDDVDLTPRKLEDEHDKLIFRHGSRDRWCFDCHNPKDRDKLRLASGRLVDFKRSYLLCGQCHGPKLRDWRAGVHGKRTGSWNGKKQYLLCVNCHNPHMPKFKPLKPKKRPRKPSEITYKKK